MWPNFFFAACGMFTCELFCVVTLGVVTISFSKIYVNQ